MTLFDAFVKERLKTLAENQEELIEAWVAKTGIPPDQAMLVQREINGVTQFWIEGNADRCRTHRNEIEKLNKVIKDLEMDLQAIKKQAKDELEHEAFLKAVAEYKVKLRNKKSFWDWFPFTISIKKKVKTDA